MTENESPQNDSLAQLLYYNPRTLCPFKPDWGIPDGRDRAPWEPIPSNETAAWIRGAIAHEDAFNGEAGWVHWPGAGIVSAPGIVAPQMPAKALLTLWREMDRFTWLCACGGRRFATGCWGGLSTGGLAGVCIGCDQYQAYPKQDIGADIRAILDTLTRAWPPADPPDLMRRQTRLRSVVDILQSCDHSQCTPERPFDSEAYYGAKALERGPKPRCRVVTEA